MRKSSKRNLWKNMILAGLILPIANVFAFAQLAVIKDKDGYTNIRDKTSLESKILGRIYERDIFYYSEIKDSPDWVEVYTRITGFVHKSRLRPLGDMKEINTHREIREGSLRIANDTLSFEIQSYEFDITKHQILKDKNGKVMKIDQMRPYGVFGNVPKAGIKSVKLMIRGKEIMVPRQEYSDLYEPGLDRMYLRVDDSGTLYIDSGNSDGAAGYELVWVVYRGKYVKRQILIP